MNKKISVGAAVSFMLVVAAVVFTITMYVAMQIFNQKIMNVNQREEEYRKLSEIDKIARQNVYGEINEDALLNGTAEGYIKGLSDKYSQYFTKEQVQAHNIRSSGIAVGIGAEIVKNADGYLIVASVYPDSSAEENGMLAGDIIVKIGNDDVIKLGADNALSLLDGKTGTKVSMTVRRDVQEKSIELTRRENIVPSLSSELSEKTLYIKFMRIDNETPYQFNVALDKGVAEGASALILDLRWVESDHYEAALKIVDRLVNKGDLLTVKYKNGITKVLHKADSSSVSVATTVLVNHETKGAAELLAVNLKDINYSKLVGTVTSGKAAYMQLFTLQDSSGLYLFSAEMIPAKSPPFLDVGIIPDYEAKLTTEQEMLGSQLDKNDDPQYKKALEVAVAAAG